MKLEHDVIYLVITSPTMHKYAVVDKDGNVREYHSLKRARIAHPMFTATRPVEVLEFEASVRELAQEMPLTATERLYLECMNCGEVFEADEPMIALDHFAKNCDQNIQNYATPAFHLLSADEAF